MSELLSILEIEPANRLDDDVWTQDAAYSNLWYLTHSPGKPSKVEEDGIELIEQASGEDLNDNPGSWAWGEDIVLDSRKDIGTFDFGITEFYSYGGKRAQKYWNPFDADINSLYIHTTGSDDPAGGSYVVLSYFWEYLTTALFTNYDVIFNGNSYLPYLSGADIPEIKSEVTGFGSGNIKQNFGAIRIINADGRYDSRLSDYIYEAKKVILKQGEKNDSYGDFVDYWRGWTGKIAWTDKEVEIETEDLRGKT